MAVATSATAVTDVYPPRVTVSVTGMTTGQMVDVYRVVGGVMTPIRGGHIDSVDTSSLVITDNEAPFGVPVYWRTRINKNSPSFFDRDSSALTLTVPTNSARGKKEVVLSDAITGNAAESVIVAWDKKSYQSDATVYSVGGKNRIVSGVGNTGQFTADIKFITFTRSSELNFRNLLASATAAIIQLRAPVSNGWIDDCYFSTLSVDVERFSDDETDERRYFTMSIAETDAWPASFTTTGFTLLDVANAYSGQTLADLAADYPTLLALAQGDFS